MLYLLGSSGLSNKDIMMSYMSVGGIDAVI